MIHSDGRLTALSGQFSTDPMSIAALGHAVHAAGTELAIRAGTTPVRSITLNGEDRSLTLFPAADGVLVLEHESQLSAQEVKQRAAAWLNHPMAAAPVVAAGPPPSLSLSDALNAAPP